MVNIQNILDSFNKVANITYDNLPDWIAIYQFVYIRDINNREEDQDGKVLFSATCKWLTFYDLASMREITNNELNWMRSVNQED
jgi:hypothetical protein